MNEKDYNFIHDLTNKLVALDGKLRKIKKCETTMEILAEVEKIKGYSDESMKLLSDYKNYLESETNK